MRYTRTAIKGTALIGFGFLGLATQYTDEFEIAKNLEIFSNIYREVHTYYVDELQSEKVMRTGINAMLGSLDPYTVYIPAEETEQFQSTISGKYGGVGASVQTIEGKIYITDVYENSPAQKAGIQIGDQLIAAAGQNLQNKQVKDLSLHLRGTPGTEVQVEVIRWGETAPKKLSIRREEILLPNVPQFTMLPNNTAYIALSTFSENAGKNVSNALQTLRGSQRVERIILDLRGNTGGLLNEAVNVANVFLPKNQLVVQIKGREIDNHQRFTTLNNPVDTSTQLIVLIDHRSASASEIVAGALQDLDRAVIVGERSFGKGLVQTTKELGHGAKLKITSSRYYIPSGRCIQANQYKDGKPVAVADSLRAKFKTRNGRTVLDGGGIAPDLNISNEQRSKLVESLQRGQHFFRFANDYRQRNSNAQPDAKKFRLTDSDFEQLRSQLKKYNFAFANESDKLIEDLEKKAKEEKLYDKLKSDIEDMRRALTAEKDAILNQHKSSLLFMLENDILRRYAGDKAAREHALAFDPTIQRALDLLQDKKAFEKLLTGR